MRLTKSENRAYQLRLLEAHPLCQICEEQQSIECHHVRYGRFGADKDDSKQIAVCRERHQWCHAHKHESIEKYEEVADENWQRFGEC